MEGVSVCPSIISTAVHPINFTLGWCIAEDPRKSSVECQVVWMSGSPESCTQQYRRPRNQPIPNSNVLDRHQTSNLIISVARQGWSILWKLCTLHPEAKTSPIFHSVWISHIAILRIQHLPLFFISFISRLLNHSLQVKIYLKQIRKQ